jgi:hypothetical protein
MKGNHMTNIYDAVIPLSIMPFIVIIVIRIIENRKSNKIEAHDTLNTISQNLIKFVSSINHSNIIINNLNRAFLLTTLMQIDKKSSLTLISELREILNECKNIFYDLDKNKIGVEPRVLQSITSQYYAIFNNLQHLTNIGNENKVEFSKFIKESILFIQETGFNQFHDQELNDIYNFFTTEN